MKNNSITDSLSSEKFERSSNTAFFLSENEPENSNSTPEFPSYLDITADLEKHHKTKACGGRWISIRCGCDGGELRALKVGGCYNENCVDCADAVKYRRTKKVLIRLNAKRDDRPLMCTTFTVPPEIRNRAENTETWRTWRKRIVGVLMTSCGFDYGFVSSHPTGEDSEKFHPHLNIVWIQKDGFRHKLDVVKLRKAWARVIGTSGEVVIWHNWHYGEFKIRHHVSYVVRTFPGWSEWRLPAVVWYGKYPRKVKVDSNDWICPDCGEKIEIVEFLKDYDKNAGRTVYNYPYRDRGFT